MAGIDVFFALLQEPLKMLPRYSRTNAVYSAMLANALLTRTNPVTVLPAKEAAECLDEIRISAPARAAMSQAMMQAANQKPSPAHQVAVVGLGYSGPPTAAVLASSGWNVCGVDVSRRVVETVNAGGVHIEDFRESPALEIAEVLPAAFDGTGAKLVPLDPALREAEVVVVLADHTACRHLGSDDLVGKLVYDARGMLSK